MKSIPLSTIPTFLRLHHALSTFKNVRVHTYQVENMKLSVFHRSNALPWAWLFQDQPRPDLRKAGERGGLQGVGIPLWVSLGNFPWAAHPRMRHSQLRLEGFRCIAQCVIEVRASWLKIGLRQMRLHTSVSGFWRSGFYV